MIVFNPKEFTIIEQDFVYSEKIILRSVMYGYIPMLEYSFSLN